MGNKQDPKTIGLIVGGVILIVLIIGGIAAGVSSKKKKSGTEYDLNYVKPNLAA
jgi:Ca2+/Na+ antiporter